MIDLDTRSGARMICRVTHMYAQVPYLIIRINRIDGNYLHVSFSHPIHLRPMFTSLGLLPLTPRSNLLLQADRSDPIPSLWPPNSSETCFGNRTVNIGASCVKGVQQKSSVPFHSSMSLKHHNLLQVLLHQTIQCDQNDGQIIREDRFPWAHAVPQRPHRCHQALGEGVCLFGFVSESYWEPPDH